MALEKSITNSILMYLNHLPECSAEKLQGNAISSGRPDINACYRGRTLRIEVKTPDNSYGITQKQEANLKKWGKSGAVSIVAYSVQDMKDFIRRIDAECYGFYQTPTGSWMNYGKL